MFLGFLVFGLKQSKSSEHMLVLQEIERARIDLCLDLSRMSSAARPKSVPENTGKMVTTTKTRLRSSLSTYEEAASHLA
jgi:hypothetical protein